MASSFTPESSIGFMLMLLSKANRAPNRWLESLLTALQKLSRKSTR